MYLTLLSEKVKAQHPTPPLWRSLTQNYCTVPVSHAQLKSNCPVIHPSLCLGALVRSPRICPP
ncbi:hypothetical protein CDEST_08148 [Colletotrichum destructivum]|uniref:Uncharacterized protein n=1 Tax=Colletotrichum destructivum TaxID=34406 RepID=A0AAX4IIE9_9PEZI|nr:hypothetical protein CDEST_08148 [Colletotrichum destructivum]